MGRAWRIEYEGALYHILSRGNVQGNIFYDNTDRWRFLDTIVDLSAHRQSAASLDPAKISNRAARLLGCDIDELKKLSRVSGSQKEKREIIIYLVWQTGLLTNEKIALPTTNLVCPFSRV